MERPQHELTERNVKRIIGLLRHEFEHAICEIETLGQVIEQLTGFPEATYWKMAKDIVDKHYEEARARAN